MRRGGEQLQVRIVRCWNNKIHLGRPIRGAFIFGYFIVK